MDLLAQKVWREGVAPLLNLRQLEALRQALSTDDKRLIQGATTVPPPLQCVQTWPVEGACLLGFCGWKGDDLNTVGEVEEFFGAMCFRIDQRLGEPAAVRYLLNYFDETDREEMRVQLLAEVEASIAEKSAVGEASR